MIVRVIRVIKAFRVIRMIRIIRVIRVIRIITVRLDIKVIRVLKDMECFRITYSKIIRISKLANIRVGRVVRVAGNLKHLVRIQYTHISAQNPYTHSALA